MTLVASLAGSDQAHKVKLGALGLTSSATGEPGTGSVIFDDPSGSLVVRSWMRVIVTETACTDAPVLFSGWVVKKSISRSDGDSTYRDGAARYIDTTLVDANTLLYFRAMFIAAANRPAESEQDRINWLLASDYLADLVIDDGMINSSDGRQLDATDYRKQYPGDLLADLVNSWIYFVYPIQPDGTTFGLFYDTPSSSTGTSTLSISNDLADVTLDSNGNVTGDVFFPQIDAVMEQDGSDIWAREGLTWVGTPSPIIHDNPTTFATYFEDSDLGYRSRAIESDRVKSEATAIAYVDRSLASHATEDETITVTIRVPAEQVGLVQAGNRMPTKFLHFNDDDFVNRRNTGIEIHQPLVDKYDLTIVLNQRGIPGTGTGGGTGDFPKPPAPTSLHYYEGSLVFLNDNGMGGGGFGFASFPMTGTTTTESTNRSGGAFYPNTTYNGHVEVTASNIADVASIGWALDQSPTYPPGTTSIGISEASTNWTGSFSIGSALTPGTIAHMSAKAQGISGPAQLVTVTWWFDPDGWVTPVASPPEPHQWVYGEVLSMAGAVGTTVWPYAAGSTRVRVDGVPISTASYTETDPGAGTVTLSWTPDADEVVTIDYQGL